MVLWEIVWNGDEGEKVAEVKMKRQVGASLSVLTFKLKGFGRYVVAVGRLEGLQTKA